MTVTDEQALLAAICAAPDDDLPRLVYADWLDERGTTCRLCWGTGWVEWDMPAISEVLRCWECGGTGRKSGTERAEFIRVQCEMARLDGGARCPICDWPYRDDGGCEPGNCSFRPTERTAEYHRWKQRQTAYHALRRRERELFANYGDQFFDNVVQTFGGIERIGLSVITWSSDEDTFPTLAFVRRGFVEAISCDLATLFGGECDRCIDGVLETAEFGVLPCPDCKGKGTTPGIAPRLFGSQPVTRVTLTDRESDQTGTGIYVGWFANREQDDMPDPADKNWLPWSIARHLGPSKPERYPEFERHHWYFDRDRSAALDALSAACVAHGRANVEGMSYEIACERCKGEGWYDRNPGDGEMSCLDCGGKGTIRRPGLPPLAGRATSRSFPTEV